MSAFFPKKQPLRFACSVVNALATATLALCFSGTPLARIDDGERRSSAATTDNRLSR
ncbi:MAG: hypothetical protein GX683_05080 [Ruminococcaceae bacterium]|nr:hypothetical protein [Oscillospiraceae bacterium]